MKLIGVVGIPEPRDYTHSLPIQDVLKGEYISKFELYNEFRKAVPEGRYGLAMSTDATGSHPLFIEDTQLLARGEN